MSLELFDTQALSTSALLRAIEGEAAGIPRAVAIDALVTRNFPFKPAAFQAVLAAPDASVGSKLAAVDALARLGCTRSATALEQGMQLTEPRVRRAAILALGRIAGPQLLDRIQQHATTASPAERDAATFAALLIACRNGCATAFPDVGCALHELETCAGVTVPVRAASAEQIELGVWAVAEHAAAIDASTETALSLDLGNVHWVVAFDRNALESMQQAPHSAGGGCVLGLISEQDAVDEDKVDFFATAVILAERTSAGIRAVAYDLSGRVAHVGHARQIGETIALELSSVKRPGVAPIELRVAFGPGPRITARDARIAPGLAQKTRLHASLAATTDNRR
jgi:hypothetical protein